MKAISLVFIYPHGDFRLDNITVTIPERSVTCVLGPNGSGKSTLLKALGGLIRAKGVIYIDGKSEPVRNLGLLRELSGYTGYPVSADALMNLKVIEVLLTSRYARSASFFDSRADYEKVLSISKELGIDHLLERRLNEVSGGELQKIMIGLAMLKEPSYFLLDEPDAHIDVGFKPELTRIVKKLSGRSTVVIATHDPFFAQCTCEHFILMSKGRVLFNGSRAELLDSLDVLERSFGIQFIKINMEGLGTAALPVYSVSRNELL